MDENKVKEAISKEPSLCDFWLASRCFHSFGGWRKNDTVDIHDSNIPKCEPKGLCEKCQPDRVLYECSPGKYQ